MLDTLGHDLRHAVRTFGRRPMLAGTAVLTLALGIGANTAMFSIVNAVLLRPLPYPGAERIVRVREERPSMRGQRMPSFMTSDTLNAWRDSGRTLEQIAGYSERPYTLAGGDGPTRLQGAAVSAGMFALLGVAPERGRVFDVGEERPGADTVVVLSHATWQRRFGADPDVVGRSVTLDGRPHTILGVLPDTFAFPARSTELWTPLVTEIPNQQPGQVMLVAFAGLARLRSGVTLEGATAEGQTIVSRQHAERPGPMAQMPAPTLRLIPLQEELVAAVRPALVALLAAVGFVLLVACANLASLLLAHGATRQRELAVRAALGADRRRLVRQLLTESLALGLAGGGLGVPAAGWLHRALPALLPADLPRIDEIQLDGAVLGFSLVLSLVTGLVFGLAPAFRGSRVNLVRSLHGSASTGARGLRWPTTIGLRHVLVMGEIALSVVLLVGAGLLLRSFVELSDVDPGYDPANIISTRLERPGPGHDGPSFSPAFLDELVARAAALPDVEAVGVVSFLPLTTGEARVILQIDGQAPAARMEDRTIARPQVASAGYFRTMGIPIVSGRALTDRDGEGGPAVVLINEAFARQYFSGGDPLGQRLNLGPGGPKEIVGIVGDVRHTGLDADATPEFYQPYRAPSRRGTGRLNLVLRTTGDPRRVVPFLRDLVAELDPTLPLDDTMTMEARLSASVAQPRFFSTVLVLFATLALLLAALGVYGVLAESVAQRQREIGVRMALGADRAAVLRLILGQGALLVTVGVAAGLVASVAASRVVASLLFGVSQTDPVTYAIVPVVLTSVALAACYLPARRATRIDPMMALRAE